MSATFPEQNHATFGILAFSESFVAFCEPKQTQRDFQTKVEEKHDSMDIPDPVWIQILGYLTADNLLQFASLSEQERIQNPLFNRLFHLCGDKDLWRKIKWQGGNVKPIVLRKLIKFLGPHTESICLEGKSSGGKKSRLSIPESFLHSVQSRCKNLKNIQFIHCILDFHQSPLKKLPPNVETISLENCQWTNLPNLAVRSLQSSPFFKLKKRLTKLRTVQIGPDQKWLGRLDKRCLDQINLQ